LHQHELRNSLNTKESLIEKEVIIKLIDRSPLAIVVIGSIFLIIGASGGIWKWFLKVKETRWRVSLGIIGGILVGIGVLLIWRGEPPVPPPSCADYGIEKIVFLCHRGLLSRPLDFESSALIQRLGYLADLLHLPLPAQTRDRLLAGVGKSTPYLGRPGQWGTGGTYDATWRIVDNVPRQELLAEIEVR